jgi:prepilin-type N-terminal cleavage/methylation domain-containing protein
MGRAEPARDDAAQSDQRGLGTGEQKQAGIEFVWQATLAPTPNPAFRKVDIASPTRRSSTISSRGFRVSEPVAMSAARTAPRGFTLLEVLLALAIMATLAITGYRALSGMIDSEQQITRERERWRDLDLFFARFEYDLGHVLPRAYRPGGGRAFPDSFCATTAWPSSAAVPASRRSGSGIAGATRRSSCSTGRNSTRPRRMRRSPTASPARLPRGRSASPIARDSGSSAGAKPGPQADDAPLPRGARVVMILNDGTRIERVFALR